MLPGTAKRIGEIRRRRRWQVHDLFDSDGRFRRCQATNADLSSFIVMVRMQNSPASGAIGNSYQVGRPRVSDAIGSALERAYAGDFDLPDDMVQLLRRIGKRTPPRIH